MMTKKLSLTILLASIFCVSAFSSENDENAPVQSPAVKQTKREIINKYSIKYLNGIEDSLRQPVENYEQEIIDHIVDCNNKLSSSLERYRAFNETLLDNEDIIDERISYATQLAKSIQGYSNPENALLPERTSFHRHLCYDLSTKFTSLTFYREPSLYSNDSPFIHNS